MAVLLQATLLRTSKLLYVKSAWCKIESVCAWGQKRSFEPGQQGSPASSQTRKGRPLKFNNSALWNAKYKQRYLSRTFTISYHLWSFEIFWDLLRSFEIFWDLSRSFEIFVPLCKTKRSTDARWQPTGALWGPCLATCKATHVAGIYRPSLDCKRLDFLKFTSWMKSSITIITKHSRTQCNVFISKSQNNRCPYSKKTKPSWLFSWLISFISQPRWEFLLWPWHGCTPSAKCLTKCICYGFQCSSKTCNYW